MKRIMWLLLPLLLWPAVAGAVELPVQAEAALLMEKETGQVLYEKNAHAVLEPASVTKVMTLLLAMEALEEGRLDYAQQVTVSDYAASMGGSQVYLSPGEQISVEDLLKAVCVASGNDAAVALAEAVSGVTELFVEQMNLRARQLGMQETHFANCTGLPAEGHVTSAWDIALMSRELILHHPEIRRFTSIWMDSLRQGSFGLSNTNKLIRFYDGATGLKTGSTDAAGYCISATAEREGMELIAVVLKGASSQQRFEDAKTLLNYGFSTYRLLTVTPEEPLPALPLRLGEQDTVQTAIDPAESRLLAEKSRLTELTQTLTLPEELEAPVQAGQELGWLTVTDSGGEQLLRIPVRAGETVERLRYPQLLLRLLRRACFCG